MTGIIIRDWDELVNLINTTFKAHTNISMKFRGQPNHAWGLTPSLTRIVSGDSTSEQKAMGYEIESQMEFRSKAHLLDENIVFDLKMDLNALLTDMQHYSCPTRLLDWSDSPFVALYFAISEYLKTHGALFALDLNFFRRNIKKLYPNVREPEITSITKFKEYDTLNIMYAQKGNHRLAKQQGCFSLSNNLLKSHDEIITDVAKQVNEESGLYKIIICNHLKVEFLARLKTMNITSESLFPGLDGLGKSIKDSMQIRKWMKK